MVILSHLRDGITVRVAYRDELPLASDVIVRDTSSSFDFAVYDDRVVTEVFGQAGKYFGRKTTQPADVAKFLHFYDLIEHGSHPVTMEDGKVMVAGEVLSMNSGLRENRPVPSHSAHFHLPKHPGRFPATRYGVAGKGIMNGSGR